MSILIFVIALTLPFAGYLAGSAVKEWRFLFTSKEDARTFHMSDRSLRVHGHTLRAALTLSVIFIGFALVAIWMLLGAR